MMIIKSYLASMPSSINDTKLTNCLATLKVILNFKVLADISKFKKECACNDFYIDRDSLSLVGTFTNQQLQLAATKYHAIYKIDRQ